MSKLNIQLSTGSRTRPSTSSRRVLWLVVAWLAVALVSVILANTWFNRDTLSGYAPNDTLVTVHLFLSKQSWTKLISDFENIPLISDRSLTIRDLATFKPNEISIFVLTDNSSAVAIRTSERNLPKETLSSYGINLQKLGRNQWLLSSKPLPFSAKSRTTWPINSIWPGTLAQIRMADFSGYVRSNKVGYSIEMPGVDSVKTTLPTLPDDTIVAAAIQPGTDLAVSPLTQQMDLLLAPLDSAQGGELAQKIQENGGLVVLRQKNDETKSVDFLIETKLESSFLSQILQISAAFKNTTTKKMEMPDGSTANEMLVEPSSVEFSSVWIGGQEAKSAKTANGQILTLDGEKTDIITSSSELLETYLNKKTEKNKPNCGSKSNLIYLKPNLVDQTLLGDHNFVPSTTLLEIALKFDEISLSSDKLYLCY